MVKSYPYGIVFWASSSETWALGGTAVVIGFAGIVLILRPGSEIFPPWPLLPIGAALGYASAAVTVRLITEEVPSALINLNSHLGALVGSTVLMLAAMARNMWV